jgi:SRSO17 transposase
VIRRFAVAGLAGAAWRSGRRPGLVIGALSSGSTWVALGRSPTGINTVHLAYVIEHAGHALIGARRWIPRAQIDDPGRSAAVRLPGLEFRTKGQLTTDIAAEVLADGIAFDFLCGDEVYGSCAQLREFLQSRGQAYVLRVARNFRLSLPGGQRLTCADAASQLAAARLCEVRSAGSGAWGQRWYSWSWLALA